MVLASVAIPSSFNSYPLLILLAALGLSSMAGLRAYLPLLAVGIGSNLAGPGSSALIPLRPEFAGLGSAAALVALGALSIGEFTVDKLPIIDHISDAIHTIIRPLSGALIMAATSNSLSDSHALLAAVSGGALALGFHGVKAASRPVVTATTAGFGNAVISILEDILVVVAAVLLLFSPVIGFVALLLAVGFIGRLILRAIRRFRGRKVVNAGNAAQQVSAKSSRGKRGRKAALSAGGGAAALPIAALGAKAVAAPQAPHGVGLGIPVPAAVPAAPGMPPAAAFGANLGAVPPQQAQQPTTPATPDATTVAATQPVPFLPASPLPDPIQHLPPNQGIGPAQTQAFPPQQSPQPSYPDDATTWPGSNVPGSN